MHFLDKFVYRNPKTEESKRGGSIMQPILSSGSASHIVASNKAGPRQHTVVNSAAFWNLKPEQVSAEDVFFHEYFSRIGKPGESARAGKTDEGKEGSGDETAEEEEIWEALVNSKPDLEEADVDGDSDMDADDFDYSDEEMEVDAPEVGNEVSDIESEAAESDVGFEGIFGDSEESGEPSSSEDGDAAEEGRKPSRQGHKGRLSRKEMRRLPTFASAEDYAELLAAEEDGLDD